MGRYELLKGLLGYKPLMDGDRPLSHPDYEIHILGSRGANSIISAMAKTHNKKASLVMDISPDEKCEINLHCDGKKVERFGFPESCVGKNPAFAFLENSLGQKIPTELFQFVEAFWQFLEGQDKQDHLEAGNEARQNVESFMNVFLSGASKVGP